MAIVPAVSSDCGSDRCSCTVRTTSRRDGQGTSAPAECRPAQEPNNVGMAGRGDGGHCETDKRSNNLDYINCIDCIDYCCSSAAVVVLIVVTNSIVLEVKNRFRVRHSDSKYFSLPLTILQHCLCSKSLYLLYKGRCTILL